jgi:Mg2+/Co2+ transporter CorB
MNTELIVTTAGVFLLLLISAFLSASETGLTAASRARIHHLANRGNRRARIVTRLRQDKERLLGAILLGNNLVNILASALATNLLITDFGDAGVVYATLLMTVLVVVFSEVLPKTYAFNHPDRLALAVAPAIRPLVFVLSPVTRGMQTMVRGILRLLGESPGVSTPLVTASDEIRSSIALHAEAGGIVKHERDMLGSIFDLADVEVSRVMVHRSNMRRVDANQPPEAIIAQVLAGTHARMPLWRGEPDNIVGVLHVKDLLRALAQPGCDIKTLDVPALAQPPWFVPETTTLVEQLNAFRDRQSHFALVVDEYGALMGLLTLHDILEEIVGDIREDRDRRIVGVRQQPDGAYVVDGAVAVRDLNRRFDWRLPDDKAATIAGLVIHEARQIPDVGQTFLFHDFKIEVLRRRRQRITTLRLSRLGGPQAAPPPQASAGE